MVELLDLPMEIFCSHIFPYLSKHEVFWNVGFVCEKLQMYSLNFIKSIVIKKGGKCGNTSGSEEKVYTQLLDSKHITNSISHIVNRYDIEYELIEELKQSIGSDQLLLEIQNDNTNSAEDYTNYCLMKVCKKCPYIETIVSIETDIMPSEITESVSCLKRLKSLILFCKGSNVSLSDTEVTNITDQCNSLEVIVLMDHVKITDSGIISISRNCKYLMNLNIHGCYRITDLAIEELTLNSKYIRSLDLYGCDKLTDKSLKNIAFHCSKIEEIDVGKCFVITDEGVRILSLHCNWLLSFDGSNCYKLSDDCVRHLVINCQKLEFLAFEFCENLTNDCVKHIANHCKNLKHLDLNGCHKISSDWSKIAIGM